MPTAVRSHAKINLGLYIGAPRADGFHSLVTVYQTLEMHDVVTVTARPAAKTALKLTSNDSRVPTDERNTAWKIVSLALDELGVAADVSIHIDKRLPVQGGLGAGSANAVAALVGLEDELGIAAQDRGLPPTEQKSFDGWGTRRTGGLASQRVSELAGERGEKQWLAKRLGIAAKVGSDVPLFLVGGTVLGADRGQRVSPLPEIEPVWCVVAVPEIGVSTPQAFRDWDALCAADGLTPEASTDRLNELSRAYVSAFSGAIPMGGRGAGSSGVLSNVEDLAGPQESALVRTGITSWIRNDFERVVFPQHPSLAEIKRILAAPGSLEAAGTPSCLLASLSGSGSALFGLYLARGDAEAALARLKESVKRGEVRSTALTRTLPRATYWREMLLQ